MELSDRMQEDTNSDDNTLDCTRKSKGNHKDSSRCLQHFYLLLKRFVAALLICTSGFLYSATFDLPGSLESEIEKAFSLKTYQFEFLYSVYSFPNIIAVSVAGLLVDKVFGLRLGSMIFVFIVLVGQIILIGGGFGLNFIVMLIGRFIYGLGAESAIMTVTCFVVVWFKEEELNFVFGLFQSISRLGSAFIFLISNPMHEYSSGIVSKDYVLGLSMIPSLIIAILLLICLAVLGHISQKNGKLEKSSPQVQENVVKLKQLVEFPLIYWFIIFMVGTSNAMILTFVSCSQEMLKTRYDLTVEVANRYSSFFNLFGAVACPIIGLIVDKVGKDMYLCFLAFILGIASQIIFCTTFWTPYIPLFLYSIYFGVMASCALLLISKVIEPYQVATAFGIFQSFLNLTNTVLNILVGYILGKYGPIATSLLIMGQVVFSLICCIIIFILDLSGKNILNLSTANRKFKTQSK